MALAAFGIGGEYNGLHADELPSRSATLIPNLILLLLIAGLASYVLARWR